MQVLERPFRKGISSKERSDLVAASSTLDASSTISSSQAFTGIEYKLLKGVIISYKSTNEQGSKCGLVKVAAVKKCPSRAGVKLFSLFKSHRLKMSAFQLTVVPKVAGFPCASQILNLGTKA